LAAKRQTRNATKGLETRRHLLEAAQRVFVKSGFAQATMRDIAEEADIALGGIYFHFRSKEDVAAAVLEQRLQATWDDVEKEISALPRDMDVMSRFSAAVHAHVAARVKHGDFSVALRYARDKQLPPEVRKRYFMAVEHYRALWQDLLEEGREKGVIRTDVGVGMLLFFLFGAVNWIVEWYDPGRKPIKLLVDDLLGLLCKGIEQPVGVAGRRGATGSKPRTGARSATPSGARKTARKRSQNLKRPRIARPG